MKKTRPDKPIQLAPSMNTSRRKNGKSPKASALLVAGISILFLISGITGLVYEVIWTRMFTTVFGNTTYAVSIVLAAFMGGLALGSFVIGKYIDKKQNFLKIYAFLELGIGVTALLMPLFLKVLNQIYGVFYLHLHSSSLLLTIIKMVLSFIVLLLKISFIEFLFRSPSKIFPRKSCGHKKTFPL